MFGFDQRVAPRTAWAKLIRDEFMRRREAVQFAP
jgi:hypothetical protein